jgi:Tlde1 domain
MASDGASVEALLMRDRFGRSETFVLALVALALAASAAAYLADSDQAPLATAALPPKASFSSFDDRFRPASSAAFRAALQAPLQALDRAALLGALDARVRDAKGMLAQPLTSQDQRSIVADGAALTAPSAATGVPLPRPRPAAADLSPGAGSATAQAGRPDDRSLLQKLSDLLPQGPIKLASLTPDSGLFRQAPDLTALGYDKLTAVYDITARIVYLPDGTILEAHSGMGNLRDDPDHVQEHMVGATPPATYELKPRERSFHGVRALRMIPVDGTTFGRSGLLTHSFMLGPDGDSNGCVSIRNYDRFLKAFDDGEINRLVVVPSLSGATQASQHSTSDS